MAFLVARGLGSSGSPMASVKRPKQICYCGSRKLGYVTLGRPSFKILVWFFHQAPTAPKHSKLVVRVRLEQTPLRLLVPARV